MKAVISLLAVLFVIGLVGCTDGGSSTTDEPVFISGVPDQEAAVLERRFVTLAQYLSEETGLTVEYKRYRTYDGPVSAFKDGRVHLAWFGGLSGVQARLAVPTAEAVAQRPGDAEFHSVFIASPDSGITSLADLSGKSFAFGSMDSNSGHLMPRYFMGEAGIDAESDLASFGFTGTHDNTWKAVRDGDFDAGALNEVVWERQVAAGKVDLSRVDVFHRTPAYVNYHWLIHPSIDETHGVGTADALIAALLELDPADGGKAERIAESFNTDGFVPTETANYQPIEDIARQLGILE